MSVWPIKVLHSTGGFFCQPRIMIFKMKRQKKYFKEKTIMCKKKMYLKSSTNKFISAFLHWMSSVMSE